MKITKTEVKETRTPEQIIKVIRGNLTAHLAVTPNDTAFLLAQYDAANVNCSAEQAESVALRLSNATLLARAEAAEARVNSLLEENISLKVEINDASPLDASIIDGTDIDSGTEPLPGSTLDPGNLYGQEDAENLPVLTEEILNRPDPLPAEVHAALTSIEDRDLNQDAIERDLEAK